VQAPKGDTLEPLSRTAILKGSAGSCLNSQRDDGHSTAPSAKRISFALTAGGGLEALMDWNIYPNLDT